MLACHARRGGLAGTPASATRPPRPHESSTCLWSLCPSFASVSVYLPFPTVLASDQGNGHPTAIFCPENVSHCHLTDGWIYFAPARHGENAFLWPLGNHRIKQNLQAWKRLKFLSFNFLFREESYFIFLRDHLSTSASVWVTVKMGKSGLHKAARLTVGHLECAESCWLTVVSPTFINASCAVASWAMGSKTVFVLSELFMLSQMLNSTVVEWVSSGIRFPKFEFSQ